MNRQKGTRKIHSRPSHQGTSFLGLFLAVLILSFCNDLNGQGIGRGQHLASSLKSTAVDSGAGTAASAGNGANTTAATNSNANLTTDAHREPASVPPPDINNLARKCEGQEDMICDTLTRALYDTEHLQQRGVDLLRKNIHLGQYEVITVTGLSILVNRKIEIKNKSIFSDKVYQKVEIKPNEAIFSFEYNF